MLGQGLTEPGLENERVHSHPARRESKEIEPANRGRVLVLATAGEPRPDRLNLPRLLCGFRGTSFDLPCRADRGYISSRFVREIARYGGSVTHMVPKCVADALDEQFPGAEENSR